MSKFKEIVTFDDGPVGYEFTQFGHIKMKNHSYPYSLKEDEFEFLTDLVAKYDLKRGYECATAFGVSSSAIGLGFKKTGGMCVTMDAYVEEKCDNPGAYANFESFVYNESDGFKSVNYLIKKFGLEKNLFPEIGWSPDDTEKSIRKHFDEPLDFVFIDAGHFEKSMLRDIDSILPLLGERYVLAFHDVYSWSFTENVHKHLIDKVGKTVEIAVEHPRGENLGIIVNV